MVFSMRGELETEQNCNISTPTLLDIAAFLSSSPGLLNRGPGGPASAGTWFSFQHLLSNLSELRGYIIIWARPTTYERHNCTLFNPSTVKVMPWSPDIFDRMHLLFTQVHFFFWQLGRDQYVTLTPLQRCCWCIQLLQLFHLLVFIIIIFFFNHCSISGEKRFCRKISFRKYFKTFSKEMICRTRSDGKCTGDMTYLWLNENHRLV